MDVIYCYHVPNNFPSSTLRGSLLDFLGDPIHRLPIDPLTFQFPLPASQLPLMPLFIYRKTQNSLPALLLGPSVHLYLIKRSTSTDVKRQQKWKNEVEIKQAELPFYARRGTVWIMAPWFLLQLKHEPPRPARQKRHFHGLKLRLYLSFHIFLRSLPRHFPLIFVSV